MLMRIFALIAGALTVAAAGAASPGMTHLDLDIALDPETRQFHAVAELPAAREFSFVLHDSLSVSAASVDNHPVEVKPLGRDANRRGWRVSTPGGARLRIEYAGTLPALDRTLGDREVLREMPPMAAKIGSFLPSGSGWYPQPAPLFSYRVKLSLPADQRGLVAGRLLSELLPHDHGGRYVATFQFDYPAQGIDLMAGPYVVREQLVARRDLGPLRLRTYFYRDLDALSEDYLNDSRHYLERYSAEIGPYPYSDFSVVASPLPTGFGMPTLTYLGAEVLKLPFIRSTSLGHEVLHNWWGNGVYIDYPEGNWSEGLTTFMADYSYKEQQSAEAAREMRLGWLRDLAAVPAGSHQSLSAFRSRTHGADAAVGYGKSAMVFFMLRDAIGKDAFSRGIRLLWKRYEFKVAAWDDLRGVFEESAGRTLRIFFEQWIQRSGAPTLGIVQARAHVENGKIKLALSVAQTSPAYALRVPVEISTGERFKTRWIDLGSERETIMLELDAMPDSVRLDPKQRIWRMPAPEELPPILRQWIIARAPRLAIVSADKNAAHAAERLARRFFETLPQLVTLSEAAAGSDPVLVIGLHDDVDAALSKLALPLRPAVVSDRGSAQVWTIRTPVAGTPIAVISADNAGALTALLRPLPHYGSQSYLAFDGSRAVARGIWPATTPQMAVTR